jgi:hypothetical protein
MEHRTSNAECRDRFAPAFDKKHDRAFMAACDEWSKNDQIDSIPFSKFEIGRSIFDVN